MKRLEDIPKKEIFNVPERYFDKLPGIVQTRVGKAETGSRTTAFGYAFRYAAAFSLIGVGVLFWFRPSAQSESPESMLANVETVDLVAYLNESDLTTEELMDELLLDQSDAAGIEEQVYNLGLDDEHLEEILDEIN
ncbi:MAG: hypothetical protein WKF87_14265 [Chryseolinea sp.]